MRIVSFNVNGLRAILTKNFVSDFESLNADIFVLEETKFSDDGHANFPFIHPSYHLYWADSKEKKGYSGVAVYAKQEPLSVHYGLEDGKYDEEGRVITLEYPSFFLVGAYVPNSGEGLKRLSFRLAFEKDMRDYLVGLDKKKPIILTGDLNVAHEEIDIKNPDENHRTAGFTDEERAEFGKLLELGFTDVFRKLHPDAVEYTWWSYRFHAREKGIGWRIDYFIVSNRLMDKVVACSIHNEIHGSDHCPIVLDIAL
jgi:exodeoxyribonuclease-3